MTRTPPFLRLAVLSLYNRRGTAVLTMLAIALSVTLFVGVEKIRYGARAGFDNTISGTDLIVGARSGPINLLLYSVFRIGDATNNITWQSYQDIAARPEVAWTVPVSLGDSHAGFRVMGTTADYFTHYRFGRNDSLALREGRPFADLFDAVLGADVAEELGYRLDQSIVLSHGAGPVSFRDHGDKPFKVVGILKKTGTPVDRTIHVSLEGIEAIHTGWINGAPSPLAKAITADKLRSMTLQPEAITAFFVGLKSKIAVLKLQRDINTYAQEPLLAIIPGVTLSQLWNVVGVAETALAFVAGFVVFTGLIGLLTSILSGLNERRREMAILRSVGARPWHIFALLVSEACLIALVGSLLGMVLVYTFLAIGAPLVESQYGMVLSGLYPGWYDLGIVAIVSAAAFVLGIVPAWRAYRQSLSDGLMMRV